MSHPESPMRYYPLLLDLHGASALVVGAGEVGRRKIAALAATALARIVVVDPNASENAFPRAQQRPAQGPGLEVRARAFAPEDISDMALVFAATPHRDVNRFIGTLCQEAGVLCNIADAPAESAFFVPAVIRRSGVTLTVSTDGASPALSRRIRADLEAWLGNRYTGLAVLLGRLRPLVLAMEGGAAAHRDLFRNIVNAPLDDVLARNDRDAARELLRQLLPEALHPHMGDLLHDL